MKVESKSLSKADSSPQEADSFVFALVQMLICSGIISVSAVLELLGIFRFGGFSERDELQSAMSRCDRYIKTHQHFMFNYGVAILQDRNMTSTFVCL